jgi:hypothetical protein
MAGKVVGFTPGSGTFDWVTMRTKYGFRGMELAPADYQTALSAGYSTAEMMIILLDPNNWQYVVDNYQAGYYYIDEPVNHDCVGGWTGPWATHLDLLHQIRDHVVGSQLVISSHMACSHMFEAVNDADLVMYSSYMRWYWIVSTECWINVTCSDQRDNWTAYRSYWPTKFTQTWVGGHQCPSGDMDPEIPNLIGHAANLGLSGIWLYCTSGTTTSRVESFCYFSWVNHFLRRFEQEYYIWYQCTNPGGCPEDPPGNGWQYLYIEYGTTREVTP